LVKVLPSLKELIELASVKPDMRFILGELAVYTYLKQKCKEVEAPPIFDFKCGNEYYEVKSNSVNLALEQQVEAYKLIFQGRSVYLVSNVKRKNMEIIDIIEAFNTTYYVYRITPRNLDLEAIQKYMNNEARLEEAAEQILRNL
jgi:hypothetical protein